MCIYSAFLENKADRIEANKIIVYVVNISNRHRFKKCWLLSSLWANLKINVIVSNEHERHPSALRQMLRVSKLTLECEFACDISSLECCKQMNNITQSYLFSISQFRLLIKTLKFSTNAIHLGWYRLETSWRWRSVRQESICCCSQAAYHAKHGAMANDGL